MSSLGGSISSGNRSCSAADGLDASRRPTAWSATARRPWPGRAPAPRRRLPGRRPAGSRSGASPVGADDLLVALVADQQDVVVLGGEPPGLVVHLGDQRAGRVDGLQAARGGLGSWTCGATPCAEKTTSAPSGTSSVSSTKIGPARLQRRHHVLVVHDLLAHVDRGAVALQCHLDGLHGAVDPGAVAAGVGEQDASGRHSHASHGMGAASQGARRGCHAACGGAVPAPVTHGRVP